MPMLSVCTWVDCVGLCIGSSQWEEGGSGFLSKGGLFFVSGEALGQCEFYYARFRLPPDT
jgi:hypothetical protein